MCGCLTFCAPSAFATNTVQYHVALRSDIAMAVASASVVESQSLLPVQALVGVGPHSRVVHFESDRELVPTIRRSFADMPRVASATTLVIQIKDPEWGGEFVDLKEDQAIPDHCVLNVHVPLTEQVEF